MDFKVISRFVVFWICCAQFSLFAQQEEIVSRHYSIKDGLPEERVNDIIQDSQGFIWLATHSGLYKFDGYSFTNYRNNPASSNSLGNNRVYNLLEDRRGRLWIGHDDGIDLFDPRTEKYYFHWADSGANIYPWRVQVHRFRERKDGKIWICTNGGVYVADLETLNIGKFTQLPFWTHDIAETKDGSVVASSLKGVYYLDAKTGDTTRFIHDPGNPKSVSFNYYTSGVKVDKRDRVWVGTDKSLELFNPHEKSFTHYPTKVDVNDILENPNGKFWLACDDGLYAFDSESGKIDKLTNDPYTSSAIRDRQGVVWISSEQGFRQLHSKNRQFNINHQFGDWIGSIAEDANHDIWILGGPDPASASLFKFNPSIGSTYNYGQLPPSDSIKNFQDSFYRSLFCDKKGNMWLASAAELEKYNAENQKFYNITFNLATIPYTGFMDSRGMVWIGDIFGFIYKFDPTSGRIEEFRVPGDKVYSFLEDSSQNVWVGSSAGLSRYNLKTGKLDVFSYTPDDPQSLSSNTVYDLIMDSDKSIWIGTGRGLNKMIKGTENHVPKFLHWRTTPSGLPNDDVYCIVEGGDRTLWMTCGNMISHFSPKQNSFRNYDNNNGLSGRDFRRVSRLNGKGLRSYNGNILFGSADGLVVFHPDSLEDNKFIPPVVISSFSIRNQAVPVTGTDADTLTWESPLTESISYTDEIRLTYDQNDFNLEFSALNFVNPERNQYKYKLEPYEKEWIETTASNRFARYTNISPGKYTFRVIGSNNDGAWNDEGATLMIIIAPPWWQTWWAYTLYGLAFVAMFLYWRNYENKRLKLKHRAEYLSELDNLKSRFFTNISHEFRTPITLILGPLKDMYNGTFKGDQKSVLAVMIRNGQRLLRLINQLLDLSKLEAGKMTLHTTPIDLVQFIREIASSYESVAADKKIRYFFYPELQELMVYIDQEKIEKVVHNLLSNAFKFTREGGEIILNLKVQEKQWASVSVKDTGIGIPADQLDKIFDRFYQVDSSQTRDYEGSGLGMALAKELVTLHHGKIMVESTEGKGTIVTLWLPLGKDQLRKDEIIDSVRSKMLSPELTPTKSILKMENENETLTVSSSEAPVLLIVEDNGDMRRYISKTLSAHYQIIEAENGKEGVMRAEESVPDLIISDIMMPEMDGYKLCELIKSNELTSHIPVILLTAKADRESKLAGLETGADDYLSKPFDADELKLIVRNRIEERLKLRERFSREVTLEPKQISITSLDEKFLTKVLAIIEDRMDDESFSIEDFSREAGYSKIHFYRKIKGLSGQSPSLFLRTIRLKRAADLLSKHSDNVSQIAYSVGFSSLSYFNKCFKEQFGVTPGQFSESSKAKS